MKFCESNWIPDPTEHQIYVSCYINHWNILYSHSWHLKYCKTKCRCSFFSRRWLEQPVLDDGRLLSVDWACHGGSLTHQSDTVHGVVSRSAFCHGRWGVHSASSLRRHGSRSLQLMQCSFHRTVPVRMFCVKLHITTARSSAVHGVLFICVIFFPGDTKIS